MNRRSFLNGLGASLIAAPPIVRAASLMPVRGIVMDNAPRYGRSRLVESLPDFRALQRLAVVQAEQYEVGPCAGYLVGEIIRWDGREFVCVAA